MIGQSGFHPRRLLGPSAMAGMQGALLRPPGILGLVALAVLVADQWTKWLIEAHLPPGLSHPLVPGFLDLVHVRNTGAAFGLLAGTGAAASWVLVALACLALGVVLYVSRSFAGSGPGAAVALGLLLGGAAGNLLDRTFAGAVTDFVDVHVAGRHWPAFNVADSAITVALVTLFLIAHREEKARAAEEGSGEDASADGARPPEAP